MADLIDSPGRTRDAGGASRPEGGVHGRLAAEAGSRFLISAVEPEIECGRYPAKSEVGRSFEVRADLVCDGHAKIAAALCHRPAGEKVWQRAPMAFIDNDRWGGRFVLERPGRHEYTIEAWIDEFATWRRDLLKKLDAGQPVDVELAEGRHHVADAAGRAQGPDRAFLEAAGSQFDRAQSAEDRRQVLLDPVLDTLMQRWGARVGLTRHRRILEVVADGERARFAAWYEMFWRSQGSDPGRGATIAECIARLPYIRDLGFDTVYLVPIHPIGRTNRKGRNNAVTAAPGDPGSPYAIGAAEGGHDAVNPEWGTLEEFRRFVGEAARLGLDVVLDFAIQCSPDHPWVRQHRNWFRWRPDGSIRFAENPPKKYEDIVNVEFYDPADLSPNIDLWLELRDVLLFWVGQGVRAFRVDNPHTKPLPFWEWVIREVQEAHPEIIFLAEAFTRPKLMKALAKVGFTQSYSYFTWRNLKHEIIDYLEELTQGEARHYMRANFFPNTPDILPRILQEGGRPAFMQRIVLAATLSSVYGMYNGYELCENAAAPGKEEYLNSEKYQYKVWDWDRPGNIKDWIRRLNLIRQQNRALHYYDNLKFYHAADDNILLYGKLAPDRSNLILIAVNLDPKAPHDSTIELPLWELGLPDHATARLEELFSDYRFEWTGKHQHVWIDNQRPAFIWRVTAA